MAKAKAYIRISGDKEDRERQRWLILKLVKDRGLGEIDFIEESNGDKKSWRERTLGRIFEQLESDDALVVAQMSYLGSSLYEIFEILHTCVKKGICVYAAKSGWSLDRSMPLEAIAMVLFMASEIERDLKHSGNRNHARLGSNSVEHRGRPKGQGVSKLDEHEAMLRQLLERNISKKWIAEQLGVSTASLWYWIKTRGIR